MSQAYISLSALTSPHHKISNFRLIKTSSQCLITSHIWGTKLDFEDKEAVDEFLGSVAAQVEQDLKEAVESAKSVEEFQENMNWLQLVAQRTLAIIAFNAAITMNKDPLDLMETIGIGIRDQLNQVIKTAKENPEALTHANQQYDEDGNAAH